MAAAAGALACLGGWNGAEPARRGPAMATPGAQVERGETPQMAVCRELNEELGIKVGGEEGWDAIESGGAKAA